MIEELVETEVAVQEEVAEPEAAIQEETPKKSGKGKKIACGCGCGCLVIILIIIGFFYWAYQTVAVYVDGFEEQGYARVFGQEIVISESDSVTGPVVYFGQQVTIAGTIDGDVAVACQQLTVKGTINGNLDILAQQVTITDSGVVTGNIHSEGVQMLLVNGRVDGEITGDYQLMQKKSDASSDTSTQEE